MAKLVALVVGFDYSKLFLEYFIGDLWWISIEASAKALGFNLCLTLYIDLENDDLVNIQNVHIPY